MNRLRVLISAYACHPQKGSEASVGWGWSISLARLHDVWVLTAETNKPAIEQALRDRDDLANKIHFHYVPDFVGRNMAIAIENSVWPPAYLMQYRYYWQYHAFKLARQLHAAINFQIAHNLTYVGFRVPGYLWKLDIPFVWGPIGGLEQTNWRLLPSLGWRGMLHHFGRNIINTKDKYLRPSVRAAMAKARHGLIAATSGIRDEIKRVYGEDSEVISEVGLPPLSVSDKSQLSRRTGNEPLRLIWIGLLEPRKALPFLFRALPRLAGEVRWQLDVFGGGPMEAKWRRAAEQASLSSCIIWHGRVARIEVLKALRLAHVLVVTSVYDLTSTGGRGSAGQWSAGALSRSLWFS